MRLLVLCERVDAEGGTETYLRTLLPALAARGDAVRVAARTVAVPGAYGVEDCAIPWSDEHDPPSSSAGEHVASVARAFAPDAILVHNVLDAAVLAAARNGAERFVYHVHDHRPFCPNGDRLYPQGETICRLPMGTLTCAGHALLHGCAYGPRARTLTAIAQRTQVARTIANADATIALSRYVADLAHRNGVPAQRLHVIPPPLGEDAYPAQLAPRPREDAVLFAGRIMPSKGARSLVRALARVPAAVRPRLDIAGDGPDLGATLREAQRHAVNARRLGRLDAGALRRAMDGATLVAVPSRWGEPYGLIGIEAFARGRPVVAYDVGGIGQWIGAGGIAVPRDDQAALARAILAVLDAGAWDGYAQRAAALAAPFRGDGPIDALRAVYAGAA